MKKIYDLIIIGGGPAGITAGIYAARKKLIVLLITKDFLGQVSKSSQIDNYPGFYGISGIELMRKFEEHLEKFGIGILKGKKVIKVEKKKEVFLVKTENQKNFYSKTIIVATGRDPRPLEVPGEKEFIGQGVSYCSICDAPFFKGKRVAVVGGGNSGFEAALDLTQYAKEIFIFEKEKKVIADEILQEKVKREKKIKIFLEKEIKKIEGREKVQAIKYKDLNTGKTFQMPIDGVFIQIGSVPATGFLNGLVKFNKADEIKIDFQTCESLCPGLFAAGDVNEGKWKQIIIACGEGARAALAVYEFLKKNQL